MSKYFIIHSNETIKHIEPIGHDFTAEDVLVVDSIPVAEEVEGKYPVLKYSEDLGLHYEYFDVPEAEATEDDYAEALARFGI